ncbi:MAG: DUF488 domain-containing protein [Thermodesulfovibrio sp.]|nr:DUF488 domain-containing protein [Thermodesulfovibrio sp.]
MRLIYTVGTSNRSITEFIEILKSHNIKTAIDVRSFPKSKRFPHFNGETLKELLKDEEINYFYLGEELGGFRKNGYEEYIKTEDFKKGIEELEKIALVDLSVFFCAEKLFFRCHRRFIAEALSEKGWRVLHIVERDKVYEHKLALKQEIFSFEVKDEY